MRNRLIVAAAVVLALGVGALAGGWDGGRTGRALVVVPSGPDVDDLPGSVMPCGRDEVYVWVEYPREAACVRGDDHAAHAGQG